MICTQDKSKTRLAIYLPSLRGGGAERVMVTLANAFAATGYRVDLVLAEAHGPYLKDVSPKVRIVDLHAERVVKSLFPLIGYLRRDRPVAMLSAMNHANVIAVLARWLAGVTTRVVVSEHNSISIEASHSRNGRATQLVYWLVKRLYRHADGIIAVSHDAAVDLARFVDLSVRAVRAIYNPFDVALIQRLATEAIDHPWFAPGQPPVVLATGRLTEQKDFLTLIRAFAQIRRRRSARLMILGEGESRGEIEAVAVKCGLTADDVQMPGFVTNPFSYMSRCGVFVLSSRWEGLANVLIEAMACGAPVVSTDCHSGPREILEGGRWGRLVSVGDEKALADATCATLNEAEHPAVAVRAADFSVEKAVQGYLQVMLPTGVAEQLCD